MRLPTPQELGLPEKFHKLRPNQELMFNYLNQFKNKRIKAACMPTGAGKSLVYIMYALMTGIPTAIVTMFKGLMDQLMEDFACVGLVSLKGRSNYTCLMREDYTCEQGYAVGCPHRGTVQCGSSHAEIVAATSTLVVTNYAKWTANRRFGIGLNHIKQVVFDEGHFGPQAIAGAMQVTLHHKEIQETLGLDFPAYPAFNDLRNWKPWAVETKVRVDLEIRETYSKIVSHPQPKKSWIKHLSHMKLLKKRLSTISTANPNNWVVEEIDEVGFQFDPIRPAVYGEAILLLNIPSVIITTATMVPKTVHDIGIGRGSWEKPLYLGKETEGYVFMEADSDFDPKDCPIYYIPTQFVDDRHPDKSMLWMRLDQWLSRRLDRKGIVHTVSHERRRTLMEVSRYSDYMLFNEEKELAAPVVEEFKSLDQGFLISPSVGTGYDFPGRQCEHIFFCKIPFAPPSKIVKAREAIDKEYRAYTACQTLDQGFGRGNRFKGDRGDCAIPDDNMTWFYRKFGYLLTRAFHRRYKPVSHVPPPLLRMPYERPYVVTTSGGNND